MFVVQYNERQRDGYLFAQLVYAFAADVEYPVGLLQSDCHVAYRHVHEQ